MWTTIQGCRSDEEAARDGDDHVDRGGDDGELKERLLDAAPRADETAELAAWKQAREQWAGSDRTWGDANNAAVQLALRGRDPFAGEFDDPDGVRFRELATRLFDAVVHGQGVDARTGAAA